MADQEPPAHLGSTYDTLQHWSVVCEQARISERLMYGDQPPSINKANARGRLLQHNDTAGLQEMAAYALNGQPLQTRRQALHETGGNGVRSEYSYELQTRRLSWLRSSICQSRLT